jgi:hypothetical protein
MGYFKPIRTPRGGLGQNFGARGLRIGKGKKGMGSAFGALVVGGALAYATGGNMVAFYVGIGVGVVGFWYLGKLWEKKAVPAIRKKLFNRE